MRDITLEVQFGYDNEFRSPEYDDAKHEPMVNHAFWMGVTMKREGYERPKRVRIDGDGNGIDESMPL